MSSKSLAKEISMLYNSCGHWSEGTGLPYDTSLFPSGINNNSSATDHSAVESFQSPANFVNWSSASSGLGGKSRTSTAGFSNSISSSESTEQLLPWHSSSSSTSSSSYDIIADWACSIAESELYDPHQLNLTSSSSSSSSSSSPLFTTSPYHWDLTLTGRHNL